MWPTIISLSKSVDKFPIVNSWPSTTSAKLDTKKTLNLLSLNLKPNLEHHVRQSPNKLSQF